MGVVAWAVSILFPAVCAGCERRCEEPGFCQPCATRVDRVPVAACSRCGRIFDSGQDHLCAACLATPPAFGGVLAAAIYSREQSDAPLTRALRRFKYDRDLAFARPLAHLLAALAPRARGYDLVVPVPLHLDRLRWRGFNQAVVLARPLARKISTPLEKSLLRRNRPTPPQVGRDEAERRRNIKGAFTLTDRTAVDGRKILLVDDVYTTGATVEECSRTLLAGGASAVDVAVVARAR